MLFNFFFALNDREEFNFKGYSLKNLFYIFVESHVPDKATKFEKRNTSLADSFMLAPWYQLNPIVSVIAAALKAIWSSHWAFVFNETPFTSAITITILTTKAIQMSHELFLRKCISRAPIPHIAAD